MKDSNWLGRMTEVAERVRKRRDPTPNDLKSILVELNDLLVTDTPLDVTNAFRALPERELNRLSPARRRRIMASGPSLPDVTGSDVRPIVRDLAVEIRAIDHVLADELAVHNGTAAYAADWLVDGRAYLIPRPHGRLGVRDQQLYTRRGLLRHRILPMTSCGYRVDPVVLETADLSAIGRGDAPPLLGSALFERVGLEMQQQGEDRFVVVGIDCGDLAVVDRQVDRACLDGCLVAVWPELAVSPQTLERIRSGLRTRPLLQEPGRPPALVVAGSHHEHSDVGCRNVAVILDGFGETVMRYEKVNPYMNRKHGEEAIVPGTLLPVLVTDEAVVAFAICKDFCDEGPDIPLGCLDVDFIVVPSMGNDTTMRGHQTNAKKHKLRFGSRTFVVQQHDPPIETDSVATRAYGYALRPTENPEALSLDQLVQASEWASSS